MALVRIYRMVRGKLKVFTVKEAKGFRIDPLTRKASAEVKKRTKGIIAGKTDLFEKRMKAIRSVRKAVERPFQGRYLGRGSLFEGFKIGKNVVKVPKQFTPQRIKLNFGKKTKITAEGLNATYRKQARTSFLVSNYLKRKKATPETFLVETIKGPRLVQPYLPPRKNRSKLPSFNQILDLKSKIRKSGFRPSDITATSNVGFERGRVKAFDVSEFVPESLNVRSKLKRQFAQTKAVRNFRIGKQRKK